jgi:hypothetical protein
VEGEQLSFSRNNVESRKRGYFGDAVHKKVKSINLGQRFFFGIQNVGHSRIGTNAAKAIIKAALTIHDVEIAVACQGKHHGKTRNRGTKMDENGSFRMGFYPENISDIFQVVENRPFSFRGSSSSSSGDGRHVK